MIRFDTVVLGGGLPGMVAGLIAQSDKRERTVLVIESASRLGGGMAGCIAMGVEFDLGTHIPQETGIARIDNLFKLAIRTEILQRLTSSVGDRAGWMVNGRVYSDSAYLDILQLDPNLASAVLEHVTSSWAKSGELSGKSSRQCPVETVAESWYGSVVSRELILPMMHKWFGDSESLSGFVLELANMSRLRVADETRWRSLASSANFRSRVAFPFQGRLPSQYQHNRMSLYPRNGTAAAFVSGFAALCRSREIELLLDARVQAIDLSNRVITVLHANEQHEIKYGQLISTLGPLTTLQLLGGEATTGIERVSHYFVHHILSGPIESELCYLYVSANSSPVFRVTNYRAFSGRDDDCRLTTEILSTKTIAPDFAVSESEDILRSSNFLGQNQIVRSAVSLSRSSFPRPTLSLFNQFHTAAIQISPLENDSFIVTGIGANGEMFFQNEILRHVSSKLP